MNGLRRIALRLLARREHSRAELATKLAPHGNQEEIETLLAELQNAQLISDSRFAEAYLRCRSSRFGAVKLRHSLHAKGIADDIIEKHMVDVGSELERARAIWARKFGAPPGDRKEWARQARFLQSRGFASDVIRRLLREPEET